MDAVSDLHPPPGARTSSRHVISVTREGVDEACKVGYCESWRSREVPVLATCPALGAGNPRPFESAIWVSVVGVHVDVRRCFGACMNQIDRPVVLVEAWTE